MVEGTAVVGLPEQLLLIARDPALRDQVYERLGDYCHQCRNRLNSLKLSLYLAMRLASPATRAGWARVDRHYQSLERRVNEVQALCRPMTLSRVTLGINLLIEDRRESWIRTMAASGRSLEFVAPADRAIASFDVERMGQVFDALVAWRAGGSDSGRSARLRWWVDSGQAHLAWEETGPGVSSLSPKSDFDVDFSAWTLPMMARVAQAHEGDCRIQADRDWKVEVSWPSHASTP